MARYNNRYNDEYDDYARRGNNHSRRRSSNYDRRDRRNSRYYEQDEDYNRYNRRDRYDRGYNRRNYEYKDSYSATSDTGFDNNYFEESVSGRLISGMNRRSAESKERYKEKQKKQIIKVKESSIEYESAKLGSDYVNVRTGRKVHFD